MEHDDVRHRLSEYLDGSVGVEEKAKIEAHLKMCRQCSDALHELRKTIEHIKTVEEIEPPVWMTQKIMATVRAEAEEKKNIFRRLFYPLKIKLPIQVIAVLFLAVTGFYIYQNIQPRERFSEAPVREFAGNKQAPQTGTASDKLAKADGLALRSKQAQQGPAYKALDMKQEYEAPSPPVPAGKTVEPAVARPAEQPAPARNEAASKKRAAAPQAAAPSLPQEQTAPAAEGREQDEGKREAALLKRKSNGMAADGGAGSENARSETTLTVSVKDINAAAENIEAAIREFDGTIIATERLDAKRIYILSLSTSHANDLVKKLQSMGAMKEKNLVLESRDDRMVFRIELNRKAKAAAGC